MKKLLPEVHLEQKMSLNDTGCSLQCYIRQILIRGKCHALAARSPRGRIQRHFQETTRLHDYDATGNIKDNSDIIHALLRSVAEDLATIKPSGHPPRLALRELWRHLQSTRSHPKVEGPTTKVGVNKVNIQ
jgi:hypothetical protein